MTKTTIENLRSIVSHLKLGELKNSTQLQGGDVNETFKLETTQGNFTLRINNPDEMKMFRKEVFCYEQAVKIDIPSPKVIQVGEFEGKIFMLLEFIEGITGNMSDRKKENWKKLGEYAKKISEIKTLLDGEIQNSEAASITFQHKYLDYNIRELQSDDFFQKENLITESQTGEIIRLFIQLKQEKFEFGLVHGDLSYSNFIETPNHEIYLIDWGSAELHVVPHFEIMLKYKRTLLEPEFLKDYLDAFIEGNGLSPNIVESNLEVFNTLMILYIMDKMRWARDHNEEKAFSEYHTEFNGVVSKLGL